MSEEMPGNPNRWRAKASEGGSGTVSDLGSHLIDMPEYLFGAAMRVCALVRAKRTDPGAGRVPDNERLERGILDAGAAWIAEFRVVPSAASQ